MQKPADQFKKIFLESLKSDLHPAQSDQLNEMATAHETDLLNIQDRFFSHETQAAITRTGASTLAKAVQKANANRAEADWRPLWFEIIEDFHRTKYWGYPTQSEKPRPKELTAFQRGFPYIWTVFQAMVLTKVAILYFGAEYAYSHEESNRNLIYLLLAIAVSFSSLIYFAWRRRHDWDRK